MSISRVKPAGWSFGEKLTSAQMNTLDTNVSTATQDAQRHFAKYTISGTSVTATNKFTLTLDEAPGLSYTLASNEVEVPETGMYLVTVSFEVTSSGTSDPELIKVEVYAGATLISAPIAQRPTTSTSIPERMTGSVPVNITTTSTQKIKVEANSAGSLTVSGAPAPKLGIIRIG